jgi:hypothetical protein
MHPFQKEKQRKCHRATLSSAVIFKSEGSLCRLSSEGTLSNRIINKLDKGTILGIGDYGKVFLGEFHSEKVAVKRIKLLKLKRHTRREELLKLQKLNHLNVGKLIEIENDPTYRQIKKEMVNKEPKSKAYKFPLLNKYF